MKPRYNSFQELMSAIKDGKEDISKMYVWVGSSSVNIWEWNASAELEEDRQGDCLVRLGGCQDALIEVFSFMGFSSEIP